MYKVDTPIGVIETKGSTDPSNPGIWISVNGEDLVLVEYDAAEEKHAVRVWNHKQPDGDSVYKQVISK